MPRAFAPSARRCTSGSRARRPCSWPSSPRGPKPDATRAKLEAINKLIAALDGQDGITFLDIGAKFLEPDGSITRETMGDFLHPTAKGYEIWAHELEPVLNKLLGETKP